MTYEFKVAADAPPFAEDLIVFVHFVDADDELMWTDDHYPPVPTTQWKPGQTIKYNRLLFVPVYPYVGDASIKVGLYGKDHKRLPLAGPDDGQRAYHVAKFQVAPQTESVYLTYKDGWHLAEILPDNSGKEWHWTKKEATLSFKNPKRNSMFFLDYGGQQKVMTEPQTVTVAVGGAVVDTFQVGGDGRRPPDSADRQSAGNGGPGLGATQRRSHVRAGHALGWSAARSARAGTVRLPCLRRNAVARCCRRGRRSRLARRAAVLAALTALALGLLGGVAGPNSSSSPAVGR